ncbi:uncharacterized protein KZ484_017517 [Pholidichthys leucotaenia]
MSIISETEWRKALTSILEDLRKSQLEKMLEILTDIPKWCKNRKSKEKLPSIIIEHYGVDESVQIIAEAMDQIPRRDERIQKLLRPFVDKLESKQENLKNGKKRKLDQIDFKHSKNTAAGFQKNNVSDSESSEEEPGSEAAEAEDQNPEKEKKIPSWRKTIHDFKTSGVLDHKRILGKVVQKSGLRTYYTKNKEKRFFFYLGLADETAVIKVMVYVKERFQFFKEKQFYTFRDVLLDENGIMKVTRKSVTAKTSAVDVPDDLELQALMLVYSQSSLCTIADVLTYDDKTAVSVQGTVAQISSVDSAKIKKKRRKSDIQKFKLSDSTGSIWVTLWGNDVGQLRGISSGDFVKVINVKINRYYEEVSLNSTDYTRIVQVQKAALENVTMEIIGIVKANFEETELEVDIGKNKELYTFRVASSQLAKAFDISLQGDFEEKLLDKIPLLAKAEIRGDKINAIRATTGV